MNSINNNVASEWKDPEWKAAIDMASRQIQTDGDNALKDQKERDAELKSENSL